MIIVIVGPTGVGKTKLSIELAKKLNGEVINADSTQIFKDLDIATAKVTEEEKENIPHHLIDIKSIEEDYTVYDYQKDCRNTIDDILSRGKKAILVGGSGLYIRAALYDYKFDDESIHNDYSNLSNEELYNKVLEIDKNTTIHKNNRKRLERFLDKNSNNTTSNIKSDKLYDFSIIGITTDRDNLYEIINKRVDQMVDNGLLTEVKSFYDNKDYSKAIMTAIGYKELYPYFDGKISLEEALNSIKTNSRRFAKRQYTFFNNQFDMEWFNVNYDNIDETIKNIIDYL